MAAEQGETIISLSKRLAKVEDQSFTELKWKKNDKKKKEIYF